MKIVSKISLGLVTLIKLLNYSLSSTTAFCTASTELIGKNFTQNVASNNNKTLLMVRIVDILNPSWSKKQQQSCRIQNLLAFIQIYYYPPRMFEGNVFVLSVCLFGL